MCGINHYKDNSEFEPSSLANGLRYTLLHMFMGSKVERKSLASEDEFEPSG